jgi:hypothetical protein
VTLSRTIPEIFDGRRMNVKIIRMNSNAQRNNYSSDTLPSIKPTWIAEGFELMYPEREAGN